MCICVCVCVRMHAVCMWFAQLQAWGRRLQGTQCAQGLGSPLDYTPLSHTGSWCSGPSPWIPTGAKSVPGPSDAQGPHPCGEGRAENYLLRHLLLVSPCSPLKKLCTGHRGSCSVRGLLRFHRTRLGPDRPGARPAGTPTTWCFQARLSPGESPQVPGGGPPLSRLLQAGQGLHLPLPHTAPGPGAGMDLTPS